MKLLLLTLVLLGVSSFLAQPAPTGGPRVPMIVAHRGASFDAPENTLAAFRLGFEQGADAIEGDFHLTADGQIVAMHDFTLKRTGGVDRRVAEMTLAEVRALDVGRWKHERFTDERAPTLAEVLAIVPEGRLFFIEIKCGPEIVPELGRVLGASGVPLERLRMISFNADVVSEVKQQIPSLKSYWLTSFKKDDTGVMRPTLDEVLATLRRTNADGLDCKADLTVLTPAFVATVREQGYEWHVWTVDDPSVARAVRDLGVDSITTNRPAFIREELSK